MAKRLSSSDLKEIIRGVVREEMRAVVTEVINEVMTERYMKKVVAEALAAKRQATRSIMDLSEEVETTDDDPPSDEEAPRALANSDPGIFYKHPIKKESPDSIFFEGTVPLEERERTAADRAPAPVPEVAARWKQIAEGANARAAAKKPIELDDPQMVERRLAEKRRALEVPIKP